ncbi:MAG: secondary thiamine-phosphate synthase enzyme YjbQ [Opitutales bacterium]|nr:secondary thiamine-phosphate synthase enzyme YjbQ [Opitutales bacterium]NRA25987.1 YjbQ family protein [Opitutales bacterium]
MQIEQTTLTIATRGQGTYEISDLIDTFIAGLEIKQGLVSIYCQHTSASLVIMENADASARRDLEAFINRLVPQNDPQFTHTYEGPDDMPSHIKMALTRTSETLPIHNGRIERGTWQGIFLWEHRTAPHTRKLTLTAIGS